jgi:hypothetical protein
MAPAINTSIGAKCGGPEMKFWQIVTTGSG